jgi:alanine dehydrogenase
MLIGVPKEIKNHEYRVGMTPLSVREAVRRKTKIIRRPAPATSARRGKSSQRRK